MAHRADLRARGEDYSVQFADVEKTYDGSTLVVKRLNLDVIDGEFLTLLGPSGSGKTTTLMMLAGFEAPTAGSIMLNGRPIERLPPHKRGIGVVFQSYALFPHMTIAENIYFPLRMRSISRGEANTRIERALDMVRMRGYGDRKPSQLSGGQQQRVALARALVFEPGLVLMDEPLGALDKQLREHMQLEIKQLHNDLGISVVYVTHDQGEALTMSDRIAIFNDGIVQQLGDPEAIYNRPETPFVAQFIGDNNIISATVASADANHCTVLPNSANGTPISLIIARSAVRLQPGQDVVIAVRPEKIAASPEPQFDNHLESLVRQTIYCGDHIRLQAEVNSIPISVKIPGGNNAGSSLEAGSTICLSWKSEDCLAFTPT